MSEVIPILTELMAEAQTESETIGTLKIYIYSLLYFCPYPEYPVKESRIQNLIGLRTEVKVKGFKVSTLQGKQIIHLQFKKLICKAGAIF